MTDLKNTWKWVEGYEGLYEVNPLGVVRSVDRQTTGKNNEVRRLKGVVLIPFTLKGYYAVSLSKDGKSKDVYVHRLVATAFIPNPNSLKEVNHKDGVKTNCHFTNLEWCTRSENIRHFFDVLGKGRLFGADHRASVPVLAIFPDGRQKEYAAMSEAGRELNINPGLISANVGGRLKSAKGIVFKKLQADED